MSPQCGFLFALSGSTHSQATLSACPAMRLPVTATPARPNIPAIAVHIIVKTCFYSLPSDERCDPRSSDLDLATCRGRLTTSASRPRIPELKPTRLNAVNPADKSGLSQPVYVLRRQ